MARKLFPNAPARCRARFRDLPRNNSALHPAILGVRWTKYGRVSLRHGIALLRGDQNILPGLVRGAESSMRRDNWLLQFAGTVKRPLVNCCLKNQR